jgi:hypothetical protein
MIVYYSALTPCIVFTYILRGVDIVSIGVVLFWTFLFSVGLSVVGLLFATATRSRNWQVLFSVVFLLALLFVGFLWSLAVVQILGYGGTPAYDEPDFWLGMAACLTGYVAAFVLFIQAAAAQIMFVSANRSTALRATMFVHQLLGVGWVMFFWIHYELDELFLVLMMFAAFYWAIVGALMTGEAPQLSPRARRSLPQSFLGRAFLTWLNPGSGTGYAFAVSNLFALAVVSIIAGGVANLVGFDGKPDDGWWIAFSLMAVAYVAAYLGVGRLVLLFLRRYIWGGLPMAFVIQVFIAAMGALLPFLIQFTSRWGAFIDEYTLMQVSNWAWTMYAIADEDLAGTDLAAYVIVPSFAAVVFVLNMVFAAREVAAEHEQTPQRVIEDEIQLHPEKAPKPPGPQNPWDYDAPPEPATS